jgi:hypothetical protein
MTLTQQLDKLYLTRSALEHTMAYADYMDDEVLGRTTWDDFEVNSGEVERLELLIEAIEEQEQEREEEARWEASHEAHDQLRLKQEQEREEDARLWAPINTKEFDDVEQERQRYQLSCVVGTTVGEDELEWLDDIPF